jgi:cobalt-zinc-cadmium efflux system outer membrane protein
MGWKSGVLGAVLLMTLSGCFGGIMNRCMPSIGFLKRATPPLGTLSSPVVAPPPAVKGRAKPNERLTLTRALWLAHIYNPELAAFSYEIRKRDAEALQAGIKPNPEMSVEVENFGGNGDASGSESAETTIMLGQLIPMGGKIRKRVQVASLNRDLSQWDYEAKRLETMKEVAQRFVRVLVAQEKLKIAREKITLAEEMVDVARRRYQAGDTSIVDETRAQAAKASSRIQFHKAGYDLNTARNELAAMWGSAEPTFKYAAGNLHNMRGVPQWQHLTTLISTNPEVARWACEMSKRWAELRLAEAERIPDVTAGFGVRRINQLPEEVEDAGDRPIPNDTALVAGISFPLPIFDRNQGNILAAKASIGKGGQESRAAATRVQSALARSYNALNSAYAEATAIQHDVIPALQSVYDRITIGYRERQKGYLDLLVAQSSLVEVRERHVEALGNYHNALAELESLVGTPLGKMN